MRYDLYYYRCDRDEWPECLGKNITAEDVQDHVETFGMDELLLFEHGDNVAIDIKAEMPLI